MLNNRLNCDIIQTEVSLSYMNQNVLTYLSEKLHLYRWGVYHEHISIIWKILTKDQHHLILLKLGMNRDLPLMMLTFICEID